jgi:hypothetical protein
MLIRTIEEIKEYAKVNKNMAWDSLKDSVKKAERTYLLPILDTPQYSDIHADLIANALDATQSKLLDFCRNVVANSALYLAYPTLNHTVSDLGIQQNKSREGTSEPANQWRYQEGRFYYLSSATQAVEELYSFLQEHKSDFPLWVAGKGFSNYNDLFIRNNSELGKYLNTSDSVRAYVALQPYLRTAELKYIKAIVPNAKILELKTAQKNNALSTLQIEELESICFTIAACAYYDSIPHLSYEIGTQAISVAMIQDGMTKKQPLSMDERKMMLQSSKENKDFFLEQLKETYTIDNEQSIHEPLCNAFKKDFWV